MEPKRDIRCPDCNSDAYYKYGKTENGEPRYQCLICGRQLTLNSAAAIKDRPLCPKCGKKMHVYMRSAEKIRFRCSDYPNCKTYHIQAAERVGEDCAFMIAANFEIREFIESNKDKHWKEFLRILDGEAMEAERMLYRKGRILNFNKEKIQEYINSLKKIYSFLQSSVSAIGIDPLLLPILDEIRKQKSMET